MRYVVVVAALLAVAVGAAGVVLGEADDSPGLQFLGFLVLVGGIVLAVRTVRRWTSS